MENKKEESTRYEIDFEKEYFSFLIHFCLNIVNIIKV